MFQNILAHICLQPSIQCLLLQTNAKHYTTGVKNGLEVFMGLKLSKVKIVKKNRRVIKS